VSHAAPSNDALGSFALVGTAHTQKALFAAVNPSGPVIGA